MNEIIDTHEKYSQLKKQHFFENTLFSFQWWILVTITVVLWMIWAVMVDKKRLNIILLVGLITSLLALIMDDIGISLNLWTYPSQLTYFVSRLYPVDVAIIPVFYMLLYQYFRAWKSYLVVLTLLSLFAIFVSEPIFSELDIYTLLRWKYWYSFPIYILMGIFVKGLVDKIERKCT
ncbi:CBO0543 family protein [Virgibacillus necropolis]|nr:CBO0543 family protein [Virgibacillus necropolis]